MVETCPTLAADFLFSAVSIVILATLRCNKKTMGKRGKTGESLKGRFGQRSNGFRTGRSFDSGYVLVLVPPDHPIRTSRGYVLEHRLVMSESLGRPLSPHELVHHINGIKTDNRLKNLELTNRADHPRKHTTWKTEMVLECSACGIDFTPKRKPRTSRPCCSRKCSCVLAREK